MKLRLTLNASGRRDDVVLTTDASATVGAVTEHIRLAHPEARIPPSATGLSLAVHPGTPLERVVPPDTPIGDSGIRSGDIVTMSAAQHASGRADAPVATLNVVAGPGAPSTFPLRRGTNLVGRDRSCDVRLDDPLVSKRHAKINVGDIVEIIDDGSANGIEMSGIVVDRGELRAGGVATIGDTTISVTVHATQASAVADIGTDVAFNRSPRLDPRYEGVTLRAPEPPKPASAQRFPIVSLIAPIMMAGMIYAITRNPAAILFVAMSPLMMIGSWWENRIANRKAYEQALEHFRAALVDLDRQLAYATQLEIAGRRREHPSAGEVQQAVQTLSPLAWTRRPEHGAFLDLRLGLGTRPSRNSVEMPTANDTTPELWHELMAVVEPYATVGGVPVVADLRQCGNVGVGGPDAYAVPMMANVIGQMVGLHSPAELVLAGVGGASSEAWTWLKWLPHVGSEFSPFDCEHLTSNSAEAAVLVAAIEDLIARRRSDHSDGELRLPVVLVFVTDDAPMERARLVQLAERGPDVGVHVVWIAGSVARLPAACRTFIDAGPAHGMSSAGFVLDGTSIDDLEPESIPVPEAERLARRLAPVVDTGNRSDDQTDLPQSVSFLTVAGPELAEHPDAIIDLWRANNSLPGDRQAGARKRRNSLRALIGQSVGGPVHLDLRTQGPHALVGGTTGAGKSEFLQSWILGMATMHSPARVTFLFVDYKGGAAFADCVDLPHSVGLVTDLSPYLVRRALTSLNAELRHREHILNAKQAKDLEELEERDDPEAPPSLVIVVDEFAALVAEVPEFVDGVVNVAQRGRSLGLHLILATQRPAGVIKDNLRANTNLRIALRMADETDSDDVIGSSIAATFDPSLPGRGVAKTGPGRLTAFQSAYVGGHTSDEPPQPSITIETLGFGTGVVWDAPERSHPVGETRESDIRRLRRTIESAARAAAIPAPRKPWLPALAPVYKLQDLPSRRTDDELVFGACDRPEEQSQPTIAYLPNRDGNVAVFGTGGTGKSTFLRTIACAAAFAPARGGLCYVYALDFGSRGLDMLDALPNVGAVIRGDDEERVGRLIRTLSRELDERAGRYAAVGAGTIDQYRSATGADDPRVILLVDGVGAFHTSYDFSSMRQVWDSFVRLATDGRPVGIHVVASADRPGSVPSTLNSAIQKRLALRVANENDAAALGISADRFDTDTPPGRGVIDGEEVQVAVLDGVSDVSRQAAATEALGEAMRRAGIAGAPPVERLAERIHRVDLPPTARGLPSLGIWDETLEPFGFEPEGALLITGPPRSGRTTAVLSVLEGLRQWSDAMCICAVVGSRSPLLGRPDFDVCVEGDSPACREVVPELRRLIETTDPSERRVVLVLESMGDLPIDVATDLTPIVRLAARAGHLVIAEGDRDAMKAYGDLSQEIRGYGTGLILQPDEFDGDAILRTAFPKINRADYPTGRGIFVTKGQHYKVQVAVPSESGSSTHRPAHNVT